MTRNAFPAALIAMAMASGVSHAATVAAYGLAPAIDSAADWGDFKGVSSLSGITSPELTWAWDRDGSGFTSELALTTPSPAARTDGWALVPEPAAWTMLLLGLGGLGAGLRARRRLSPAPAYARIKGRR